MTPTRRVARWSGLARTTTAALLAVLLLVSCSGGGDGGGTTAEGGDAAAAQDADAIAQQADAAGSRSGAKGESAELLQPTYQIKQGWIQLESNDVAAVGDKLYALAARVGGEVANEQTRSDEQGRQTQSTLLLLVPVDTFDEAMQEIPGYGSMRSRELSKEDVTAQVTDLEVRVDNARESIAQLRVLFQRATRLGHVILLESELSSREADLESLLAQQRALAEKTAMSQISVTVTQPPDRADVADDDEDRAGFLAGLEQGWDAMVAFVLTVGHAAGAALPITVLLLGAYLLIRPVLRRVRPTWWRPSPSE